MSSKHPRAQTICFFLSLAAVLFYLTLYGLETSDAQETSEIGIAVPQYCGDKQIDDGFFHARIYIDNAYTTTTLSYPAGTHEVRVEAVPESGEEGRWVVKEIQLLKGGAGEPTQRFTPNTAVANVSIDFPPTSNNDWYLLRVSIDRCGTAVKNEVALAAVSEDCKDFDWEGSSIKFGTEFRLNKSGIAHGKTVLEPGTYKVSFDHPNLHLNVSENPATASQKYVGLAQISRVEVYRPFPKQVLVGTYPADENGVATVALDAGLWNDNNVPYLKVHVAKLCDLRFATVEFFQGQVEITERFQNVTIGPRPAESGINLFRNDTIKMGPGSSIQLKSQGGAYLITISVPQSAATAQLNIGTLITAEGRKFIEASTESTTRIDIKRLVIYKPTQPPPAPNVPPELLEEPMPVIVKTPTLTTTDKQTIYMVSYDDNTGVTTVGVEEGEVEVTPTNTSLQRFTLTASQQVEVTKGGISAITTYSGPGSNTGRILLYIGLGLMSVLILIGLFLLFRRHHRLATQPVFYPAAANQAGWSGPAVNVAPHGVNQGPQRCTNPQCGQSSPVGGEVCPHCGTRLNV